MIVVVHSDDDPEKSADLRHTFTSPTNHHVGTTSVNNYPDRSALHRTATVI